MVKIKRWLGFLLAAVMLLVMPCSVIADTKESLDSKIQSESSALNDAQSEKKQLESNLEAAQALKESLEEAKGELAEHVVELDNEMSEVSLKLSEVEQLLASKEVEHKETEEKLAQAKEDVKKQYEDMKIRIQFMYEHGSMSFIEILLSCSSFSEMLNKAEYIEQVSAYDRAMLEYFEETKIKVEKLEKELSEQKEVLSTVKTDVRRQQDEMKDLIDKKQLEIEEYESDISNKEKAIKEYEEMIEAQNSIISALEASVAAAKAKREQMNVSGNSAGNASYSGGAFCWPAPSYTRISDDYGWRTHPTLGVQQFHNGVDMAAPSGSPILAAADGSVVAATYNATMGNYVMIDHGGGLFTIYMHASALYVSSGQQVSKGDEIAAVGSTGRSTGPHLHFGVRLNGSYANPWNYL
ncbi:MAG: peptidoglycan DD-metalloendopeptidase family protein [Lachnospiraceae bacterium]|nr:peptidoglycan DD-metalloendopeptidase family protein [Lachnospiraceae bacterium]